MVPVILVKNLMIITCISGRGGASIYGKEFDDEIHSELKHTGRYSTLGRGY